MIDLKEAQVNNSKNTNQNPLKDISSQKQDFVKWFSELDKNSGSVAGGKGANLGEIYNLKVSVPPGFVVTAQAYEHFIKNSDIDDKMKELLKKINYEDTEQLTNVTNEIRTLMEKSNFPKEMEEEILESYEILSADDSGMRTLPAHHILKKSHEGIFVAVRSSATTEDLADASFAGQQDTFLNVKGGKELLENIKKCFSSLFTPRATYYRNKKGFKHEESRVAVIVQKMIDSDKSGVIFSKDPALKRDNVIIEAVWGLGEGIVSGQITPDRYVVTKKDDSLEIIEKEIGDKKIAITRDSSGKKEIVKLKEERSKQQVLKEIEIKKLSEIALDLEEHYAKPQDIEFAIENNEIYIVQTRPITTLEKRLDSHSEKELKGEVILKGLAASPGIGSGKIKLIEDLSDLKKIIQGDILVTKMTNPDMVVAMQKSAAIVTDEGGLTAHAAIVSREMGIPAVVGTHEATTKLKEGEIITVNGFTGKIYKGKISENIQKEIKPVTSETKTKLKVIIDLPSFAERAARTKLKEIGLARIEGIIAESGKHPLYFLESKKINEYEEIVFKGISQLANYFDNIWVRSSDIRSDEFENLEGSPKDKEANPMLGMHGIRFGIKKPEILKAELNAMKKVSESGKQIGVLVSQVISVDEIREIKKLLKEIEFTNAKVGVMVETPAAVHIIKELCEEGIDFISFGTNDLTQYTLAVDRGNKEVQDLYNEMHPAVLSQIKEVIETCKSYGVETSICGQAGSNKEMVSFLIKQGINSISVNADAAAEIAEHVSEIEKTQNQKDYDTQKIDDANEKEFDGNKEIPESKKINHEENKSETPSLPQNNIEEFEEPPKIRGSEFLKEDIEDAPYEEKEENREIKQPETQEIKIEENEEQRNYGEREEEEKQTNSQEENKKDIEVLDIF